MTAIQNPREKGIVSFESSSGFVFPEGEVPPPVVGPIATVPGVAVTLDQFTALSKIPIVIYFGDNIPKSSAETPPTATAVTPLWCVCRTDGSTGTLTSPCPISTTFKWPTK